MKIEEYKEITRRALGNIAQYLKPKEIQAIYDFIATVTQQDIDEPKKDDAVASKK